MPDFPVIEMTPKKHAWDYGTYDSATARLFNALKIVDDQGVPTARVIPLIFATPERAWARMRRKFQKDIANTREFKIPLPFISLQQIGDTTYDPQRYLYRKILYRKVALETTEYKEAIAHAHPLPYTFQYSAEMWTKTRLEARVAVAQFAGLWDEGGMLYRDVDHGTPMGVKTVPWFLEGMTDNTNLEPVDQQRSLRWTFSIRLEGWLPPVPITQKLVHSVDISIEDDDSLCSPDDPYGDNLLEFHGPMSRGDATTGEIVDGVEDFSDDYSGTDYRLARFNEGNPCVEL